MKVAVVQGNNKESSTTIKTIAIQQSNCLHTMRDVANLTIAYFNLVPSPEPMGGAFDALTPVYL